jgi:ABC-2 type transport system permease protein
MHNIWTIAKREYKSFFDSLVAYILLGGFLLLGGGITWYGWIFNGDIFLIKQATLVPFFIGSLILLVLLVPGLTMRMFAQEKSSGTLETLLTRAISDWEVVFGKYLACLLLVGTALLFTLPYYISVSILGDIDHGATLCGYLGYILVASAYIGIGIFASSLTDNQIVAFLITVLVGLLFFLIIPSLENLASGNLADFLHFMSFQAHYESIARGVIDLRDVVFFLSFTFLGLVLAEARLAQRNLVDA